MAVVKKKVTKPRANTKAYYVDNAKFLEAIVDYQAKLREARELGKEKPQMPNYLGMCFLNIAERFSHGHSFRNYRFREDMVADAVMYCVKYVESFDPSRSSNPFSYFTQTVYHTFLREIAKEKKYLYTKLKTIENTELFSLVSDRQDHDQTDYGGGSMGYTEHSKENMLEFIETYENKMEEKKNRGKPQPTEDSVFSDRNKVVNKE